MIRRVTFQGNPLTLVGRALKEKTLAPDFRAKDSGLKEAGLQDFKGKIKILTSFPSIDTSVCDLQVKEFNKRAAELSSDVVIVGISKDLPFAQKRFCDSNGIKAVKLLSDYALSSFGINYGLLIKELNLLARAVIIVDQNDLVRYVQVVEEITQSPDYAQAFKALEEVVKDPKAPLPGGRPTKCMPCDTGTPPLAKEKADALLKGLKGWEVLEGKKIRKEFKFKDFVEAKYFVDLISLISEEQGHHPTITLIYNKVKITLTSHASGGLTENDFIMASIFDETVA
jgi:thiol peroxidase